MALGRIGRRKFLKLGASLSALGIGMPPFLQRALAGPTFSNKKVLFMFLRGGMDGIQAVIPWGDQGAGSAQSYEQARPNLSPDPSATHDLNGFCSLFPAFQGAEMGEPRVADIFHGSFDERGQNLAVIHRCGYENQNRSHFSSQQFYENGIPGNVQDETGVLNRYITAYPDASTPIQAAALNTNQMVLLKGETLVPVLRSIGDFDLPANVNLGIAPNPPGDPLGAGLKGAYGQAGFNPLVPYNSLTYSTGSTLLDSIQFFRDNVDAEAPPAAGAEEYYNAITSNSFRGFVQDCARLLKQVDGLQVVGCNQGGYDTHGSENVNFPDLTANLGRALTALYIDLKDMWNDVIVFTITEFGRTSAENANLGTDHAEACVMFAMGGAINGGVYNCDSTTWPNGTLFSTSNGRYLSHRTDFRAIYHEIITKHLGDPEGRVDEIIPNYTSLSTGDVDGYFTPLNFINAGGGGGPTPMPVKRPPDAVDERLDVEAGG